MYCRYQNWSLGMKRVSEELRRQIEDIFWLTMGSIATTAGGCWIWPGPKNHYGYGWIPKGGVHMYAHRLSYALHYGSIPTGLQVLHNCPGGDNPACCSPSHLWAGTIAENIQDAAAKGRMHGHQHRRWRRPKRYRDILTVKIIEDLMEERRRRKIQRLLHSLETRNG